MSHGQHRAPKPKKNRRLRRIAATVGLAAAAATGISLTADIAVTPQSDSGWGAPDTAGVTVATETGAGLSAGVNVPLGDSGWG